MATQVSVTQATREITDVVEYEDAPLVDIVIYKVRGGYAFTYTSGVSCHDTYVTKKGTPFRSAEAALRAAQKPEAEVSEYTDLSDD